MFFISVFICFCIASVVNFFKTRRQRGFIKNLKGPFTFPLTGSLHKLIFLTPKNFQVKSTRYIEKFGSFSRCWIFHRLFILTADYELVEQLLKSESHLNTGYNLLKPWLGAGLLMLDGVQWSRRRQLISHAAFAKSALQEFLRVFDAHSKILVERLRGVSDGQTTFNIAQYVSKAVLDIMIDSTMGIKGHAQLEISTEYVTWITELTRHFTERYLRLSSANTATFTVMCPLQKRRQNRLIKSIKQFTKEVIDEKRSRLQHHKKYELDLATTIYTIQMANGIEEQTPPHLNLLDILLAASIDQQPLSDIEIMDELNTFLLQGYWLATSTLNFTLFNLARYPRVQSKAFEEIKRFCNADNVVDLALLDRLEYLECVIKETLRLYPALPVIGRELTRPFDYTHSIVGNGTLPIGSEIYISLFEMLRCEAKFENPSHFIPERFADGGFERNNDLLFFSMGPRNCIARKFAILLLKMSLVNILRAFEVLPLGDQIRLEFKIVLNSSNGFQVGLQAR